MSRRRHPGLAKLNERNAEETISELGDQHSRCWDRFEVDGISLTSALELMRGDHTEVLYNSANEVTNVTRYFETSMQSLSQTENKAIVKLEDRKRKTT